MSLQLKAIFFIIASAGFVCLSWPSLRNLRSHGFYRFFAFEAILVLVLLNLEYWFYEPLSPRQIFSWILLIVSAFMPVYGFLLLRKKGKPDRARHDDPALMGIEKTTELVTSGAYRYIRHPIYSSLLFGAWGAFLKHPSWTGFALVVAAIFFLTVTAKTEEAENSRFFGAVYQGYMKRTKMFIPWLF
jgi:protein-S-isoprenylcysteine O-methyltransferase Ste14